VRSADDEWNDEKEAVLQLAALDDLEYERRRGRKQMLIGCGLRVLNNLVKDARRALNRAGSTRRAGENAETRAKSGELFLDDKAPLQTAMTFLDLSHNAVDIRTLHYHRGDFYGFAGTHYKPVELEILNQQIYRFLDAAWQEPFGDNQPKKFNPNRTKVGDVLDALRAETALGKESSAPAWLTETADLPADEIIACQNGLLHPPTRILLPHTPAFFNHNCLNFAYDAAAPAPTEWLRFLEQIWGDDEESIATLREMFGYTLTSPRSTRKSSCSSVRSGRGKARSRGYTTDF
jgi:putative DNA primase/helicase